LGELSVTDACIKTWLAAPHNIPFIRLVVTSSQLKKLQHFKKLHGHHVLLRYFDTDSVMVMAVISKVMREELILTLKGFPTGGKSIFLSKTQKFRIEIDHEYERRCDTIQGSNAFLESIRRRLFSDTDIRLLNSYLKLDANGHRRKFASFGCKNTAFRMIPIGNKSAVMDLFCVFMKVYRTVNVYEYGLRIDWFFKLGKQPFETRR
uniref:Uncharacterized protein n=1 Tax=Caenorhabditis japonica TaxID=281687 RepID=A0A8R1ERU7_CAEJA